MIWSLIVGGVIGAIAGAITNKGGGNGSLGLIMKIVAGLVGSAVGQAIFGDLGLQVAGMAVFPSILGAIIVILVINWLFKR